MSYYKTVDGKKMDAKLLELAEKAIAGQGDGRISVEDAEVLVNAVKDGGNYTDVEKLTMAHIRDNFKWSEKADDWFRKEIASWSASK